MTGALGWLLDPYGYSFMQRALLASALVGVVGPLVGVWVVLGRLSYVGDAMGHATLAGVAVAYLAGASIVLGALGAGIVMAVAMALLARHPRLRSDAIVGIAEVALFALGILLISRSTSISVDLTHFLFGSVTTVSERDLLVDALLTGSAVIVVVALFGDLRAATFDASHSRLVGVPVAGLQFLLLILIAIAVVISLSSVGLLMSIAMLVVPAAAARLWASTLVRMTLLAVGLGVVSGVVGLTVAFHLGSAPGATIALTTIAALVLSVALTLPRRVRPPLEHAWER